jgi:hypothetical protein
MQLERSIFVGPVLCCMHYDGKVSELCAHRMELADFGTEISKDCSVNITVFLRTLIFCWTCSVAI